MGTFVSLSRKLRFSKGFGPLWMTIWLLCVVVSQHLLLATTSAANVPHSDDFERMNVRHSTARFHQYLTQQESVDRELLQVIVYKPRLSTMPLSGQAVSSGRLWILSFLLCLLECNPSSGVSTCLDADNCWNGNVGLEDDISAMELHAPETQDPGIAEE